MAIRQIVLVLALAAAAFAQEQPLSYHCALDGDIDPMRRAVIEGAANSFVQKVLSGEPGAAWDTMTSRAQTSTPRDRFIAAATLGPIAAQPRNATLRHTFLIHVVGTPAAGARVTCGDPADPAQSYRMAVVAAPEQAYALITADTTTSALTFTLWLTREANAWKVNDFASNTSTLAGRDALHLLQLAREQARQEHNLNAVLLYLAAAQVAERGPDLTLGIADSISAEQAAVPKPKEFSGVSPFLLEDRGKTFTVRSIGAAEAGDKLYLGIAHDVDPWRATKQVESANRELISLIKKRFPEYSAAFGGLLVQAVERGTSRTYATADDQLSH